MYERALQISEDGEKVVSELNLELIVRNPIILTVEKNREQKICNKSVWIYREFLVFNLLFFQRNPNLAHRILS